MNEMARIDGAEVGPEPENLYANYRDWKSWRDFAVFTPDHAGYFEAELADLKIADADVLEIGFGAGTCLGWLREKGARLYGTELSETAVRRAAALGVSLLDPDLPAVAERYAARFDTILAFDVLEHMSLADVAACLAACETMLRPGGQMLIRFPNAQSPFGLHPQMGDPTHRCFLSGPVVGLLIAGTGLTVRRQGGAHHFMGPALSGRGVKRRLRGMVRGALGATFRFAYGTTGSYDPVLVMVLERPAAAPP